MKRRPTRSRPTESELNQFSSWWSSASRKFARFATEQEFGRVEAAFSRVLLTISQTHFDRFIDFQPHLLCCPRSDAAVWRFPVKVDPKKKDNDIRIIYLAPDFENYPDERLDYAVAHEVAHVIDNPDPSEEVSRAESRATALVVRWGFDIKYIEGIAVRFRETILETPIETRPLTIREFPLGSCGDVTLLVGTLLSDLGLDDFRYISGERGLRSDNTWESHAWAKSGSLIVDIAADQFPEIDQPAIVTRSSSWHQSFEQRSPHTAHIDKVDGPGMPALRQYYKLLKNRIGLS